MIILIGIMSKKQNKSPPPKKIRICLTKSSECLYFLGEYPPTKNMYLVQILDLGGFLPRKQSLQDPLDFDQPNQPFQSTMTFNSSEGKGRRVVFDNGRTVFELKKLTQVGVFASIFVLDLWMKVLKGIIYKRCIYS